MASALKKELEFMQWPRKSYAQMGEDLIIENNLNGFKLKGGSITYLEVGTNHPCDSNNTFLFYEQGSRGVLVEPDEYFWQSIEEKRPEDVLIKACVADYDSDGENFHIMTARSLNTLDRKSADEYCQQKHMGKQKIERIIKTPVINVNKILSKYFNKWPNVISIDTEGVDYSIIKAIDWETFRAELVCVEVTSDKKEITEFMRSKRYNIFGDNRLNMIFGRG